MESVKPILIGCWVKYAGKLIKNNVLRRLCCLDIEADQDAHGLPDGNQGILQDNCPAVKNMDQNDFNWVVLVTISLPLWSSGLMEKCPSASRAIESVQLKAPSPSWLKSTSPRRGMRKTGH